MSSFKEEAMDSNPIRATEVGGNCDSGLGAIGVVAAGTHDEG